MLLQSILPCDALLPTEVLFAGGASKKGVVMNKTEAEIKRRLKQKGISQHEVNTLPSTQHVIASAQTLLGNAVKSLRKPRRVML